MIESGKPKVLIVDDCEDFLEIMVEDLGDKYDVITAANGANAVDLLDSVTPEVVILDINMPGENGFQICREIRIMPALKFSRIILVTGGMELSEKLKAFDCGADSYLMKPLSKEELIAKIESYLRLANSERSLAANINELEEKVRIRSEQLFHNQNVAFIGMHAAELVHNLSNPLAILRGNLLQMKKQLPEEKRLHRALSALDRMQQTIKSILDHGRKNTFQNIENTCVSHLIKDELQLLDVNQFFKYQVETSLDLAENAVVQGSLYHFSQVLSNLIKNALDAMHQQPIKKLTIRTYQAEGQIKIIINDTGHGIDSHDLVKIFNPFYSTKPMISEKNEPIGTGLGLAYVKRFVEYYGGNITIESKLGIGTTVTVSIPAAEVDDVQASSIGTIPVKEDTELNYENTRLQELEQYKILYSPNEQSFDELVNLAAKICQTSMVGISIVGHQQVWFKSKQGLTAEHLEHSQLFCREVVNTKRPLIITDTMQVVRYMNHPLVANGPKIRFYIGLPLINANGFAIGAFCIFDTKSRKFSTFQMESLHTLARQATNLLEWRKQSLQLLLSVA